MKKKLLIILSVTATLFLASCSESAPKTSEETMAEDEGKTKVAMEETDEVQVVKLEEVEGEFTTKELTLKEGMYKFEVTNNGVDHDVAFVLAPAKENIQEEDYIADAMLTATLADGETASSKEPVKLEKGEYVYFCPMNPTPHYKLTVE